MKRKGMIFAAGLGTRLKPWTDHHPKALAIVNEKSILQRNIEYFLQYGIVDIVVNVHHFADQIIEAVTKNNGWGANISFSDERDELLETGGGLKKASPLLEDADHIFIMNADILTNFNLNRIWDQHIDTKAIATLAVTDRITSRYFLFNYENQLVGWENTKINKKIFSRENEVYHRKAFSGIHLISKELFNKIHLTGKFSMVDLYLALAEKETIYAINHTGDTILDVGNPDSIVLANKLFL